MNQVVLTWSEAIKNKSFNSKSLFFVVMTLLVVYFLPHYFHSVIGPKPGILLNDPLHHLLPPQDHSWIIFGLIYCSLLITLQGIWDKPLSVLLGLKCYLIITLLRMMTMFVITLEPPDNIIPLHDPIVDVIAYGGVAFNKDLFFSGHLASLTLFALLEVRTVFKNIIIFNSVIIAGLILVQHVHYTIDLVAAPVFTMVVFYLLKKYSR